jgi:hypothetical protein
MFISHDEMQLITSLRTEQGLIAVTSWDEVYRYADEALHGALKHYESKAPHELPHVHYQLNGAVADIAWPETKLAIYGSIDKETYDKLMHSCNGQVFLERI